MKLLIFLVLFAHLQLIVFSANKTSDDFPDFDFTPKWLRRFGLDTSDFGGGSAFMMANNSAGQVRGGSVTIQGTGSNNGTSDMLHESMEFSDDTGSGKAEVISSPDKSFVQARSFVVSTG